MRHLNEITPLFVSCMFNLCGFSVVTEMGPTLAIKFLKADILNAFQRFLIIPAKKKKKKLFTS